MERRLPQEVYSRVHEGPIAPVWKSRKMVTSAGNTHLLSRKIGFRGYFNCPFNMKLGAMPGFVVFDCML